MCPYTQEETDDEKGGYFCCHWRSGAFWNCLLKDIFQKSKIPSSRPGPTEKMRKLEMETNRWRQSISEDFDRNGAEEELNLFQKKSLTRKMWKCWVNEGSKGLPYRTELKTW